MKKVLILVGLVLMLSFVNGVEVGQKITQEQLDNINISSFDLNCDYVRPYSFNLVSLKYIFNVRCLDLHSKDENGFYTVFNNTKTVYQFSLTKALLELVTIGKEARDKKVKRDWTAGGRFFNRKIKVRLKSWQTIEIPVFDFDLNSDDLN